MTDFLKLHEDLATADRHIAESKARVDRQADVARELDEDGHDTTEAQELLRACSRAWTQSNPIASTSFTSCCALQLRIGLAKPHLAGLPCLRAGGGRSATAPSR